MANNGNNSTNGNDYTGINRRRDGNGRSPWKNIGAESFGLGVAEFVSMGVSLGVVAVADQVAPNLLKNASKVVGKILEPYLEPLENGLQKVCKLEECQPDKNKPSEERAENLAKTLITFTAAWALSMVAKLGTRTAMNSLMKVSAPPKTGNWFKNLLPKRHDLKVVAWDEGVHIGSLILLNTVAAKRTDEMINTTSHILQKWGISEKKSREIASMGIIWELPNALGWLAGVGAIAHDQLKKTHVEQFVNSSVLNGHTPAP